MKNDFAIPDNFELPDHHAYFATARSYVESIFVMMSSKERFDLISDVPLAMSTMLLGGFAVELYLKACLRKKGMKANDIKTHDLNKLFNLCKEKGFKDIDDSKIRDLIELFAERHKSGEFRYIKKGRYKHQIYHLPDFFDCFNALDSVVTEVVGGCHYHGRSGDRGWKFRSDEPNWRIERG